MPKVFERRPKFALRIRRPYGLRTTPDRRMVDRGSGGCTIQEFGEWPVKIDLVRGQQSTGFVSGQQPPPRGLATDSQRTDNADAGDDHILIRREFVMEMEQRWLSAMETRKTGPADTDEKLSSRPSKHCKPESTCAAISRKLRAEYRGSRITNIIQGLAFHTSAQPSVMTYSPFPPTICRLLVSIIAVAAISCGSGRVAAAEPAAEGFGPVRKLMETRCLSCHNDHDREGDFSLQSHGGFLSGDYVIPGNARDSHILQLVVSQDGAAPEMPKEGNPLTPDEVALFKEWIDAGAVWPEAVTLTPPAVDDFDWWSFQPVVRPPAPADSESGWIRTPIDAFIQAQHHRLGLTPAPEADRRTLIRRLTYDLTGLPPTPEQIHRFVADSRPEAYAELVDRLLMSPRYGERWARHWLDVVRYADTCGYDKDKLRPNAWPYRDYVIRAFNDDKPYSRFVQEQVAGDVLYPGEPDGILGLGFIAAGPWDFIGHVEVPESKLDGRVARNLDRDEMVTNTLNAFCSVTIQCARCHNHKFDPFRQEHYYSLQSVFAAVDRAERPYDTEPEVERKRQQLTDRRDQLLAELKKFDDDVKKEGGAELSELNELVAELKPRAVPADKRPEFGYYSGIAATANTEKWVEVDLGQEFDIAQVILHPCHDDFAGIGAGFGFPVRFRIDARADQDAVDSTLRPDDTSGAADDQRTTAVCVGDFSQADYANPGLAAVPVNALGTRARFIRLTATQLAERSNDFILAIAELEVLSTDGKNVARGARVQALDSIEAPTRWRKSNLTDGIWVKAADPEAVTALARAETRRTELLSTILTPDRVARRQQLLQERDEVERDRNALPPGHGVCCGHPLCRSGKLQTDRRGSA